ncbi:hypothetical protein BDD12DRAFT_867034 [Trichophaea hybrida]|nr:hypothetical protein BDD12DRAFT_867034 [Trichophaea hybrida]
MLPPPPTPRPVSVSELAVAREIFKLRLQNPLFDIYGRNPFDTQPRVFSRRGRSSPTTSDSAYDSDTSSDDEVQVTLYSDSDDDDDDFTPDASPPRQIPPLPQLAPFDYTTIATLSTSERANTVLVRVENNALPSAEYILKIYHPYHGPATSHDGRTLDPFTNESSAYALFSLDPDLPVPRCYGHLQINNNPALLLEYIPSATPLGVTNITESLSQDVLGAFSAIHTAGVIQFDVAPRNVLVTKRGGVVVVDFDVAVSRGCPGFDKRGVKDEMASVWAMLYNNLVSGGMRNPCVGEMLTVRG